MLRTWRESGLLRWSQGRRRQESKMTSLRFKVDENLPIEVAVVLRNAGFLADTVWDEGLSGASDQDIALVCRQEGRALITLDLDFADIRTYPPEEYAGIIVLRLRQQDKISVLAVMQPLISLLQRESVRGHLWIVDEKRVRIR